MTQKVGLENSIAVTANSLFDRMLASRAKQDSRVIDVNAEFVIGLDPGETTGVAWYFPANSARSVTIHIAQLATPDVVTGFKEISKLFNLVISQVPIGSNIRCVCEDYKIYGWKADTHKWAGLHTPQLIGAIQVLCYQEEVPLHFQMAVQGKSFATDQMLQSWNLYDPGMKHGRDASRHIVRHMFFPD